MKSTLWIVLLGLTGVIIAWWFWPNNTSDIGLAVQQITPIEKTPLPPLAEQALATKPSKTPPEGLDDAFNSYQEEELKAQLMQVADLYAETLKYPHDSQPIFNPEDARDYQPFEKTEVDTPYPVDGLEQPIRLQAAVDKYQYFLGETIYVRLRVLGAPTDTFTNVTAVLAGTQADAPLAANLQPTSPANSEFFGEFDTTEAPPARFSPEMLVKIEVTIGEETLFTTVGLRISSASAQLVGIPYTQVDGPFLTIPLQYTVYRPGYYYVSGVLEDATTARPLIRLQAEGRLQQGNGILTMRAHIRALKAVDSEGPYILRSLNTYRGAGDGESFDAPASSVQPYFEVQGFPFSQYDDLPHDDELSKERLEFLRNIGALESNDEQ